MANHNTYIGKDLIHEVPDYSKLHKQQHKILRPGLKFVWSENIFTQKGAMMGYAFDVLGNIAVTQGYMISKYYRLHGSPKIRFSFYRGEEPWVTTFIRFDLYDEKKHRLTPFLAPVTITQEDETYAGEVDSTGATYFRMSCNSGFTENTFNLNIQIKQYK